MASNKEVLFSSLLVIVETAKLDASQLAAPLPLPLCVVTSLPRLLPPQPERPPTAHAQHAGTACYFPVAAPCCFLHTSCSEG